jgi:hypothetical protein
MELLERRLLSVLEGLPPSDTARRQSLAENLVNVRRERAVIELRLSADQMGAKIKPITQAPDAETTLGDQTSEASSAWENRGTEGDEAIPEAIPTVSSCPGNSDSVT